MPVPYEVIMREIDRADYVDPRYQNDNMRQASIDIALRLQARIMEYSEPQVHDFNPVALSVIEFVTHAFMALNEISDTRNLTEFDIRAMYQLSVNILQECEYAEA